MEATNGYETPTFAPTCPQYFKPGKGDQEDGGTPSDLRDEKLVEGKPARAKPIDSEKVGQRYEKFGKRERP